LERLAMARFRLFATLSDGARGRCQIFCDGHQHFLFERTRGEYMVERFRSSDPNRFHHYVHDLCAQGWSFAWARNEGG
jgi:hypothetical protein